MLSLLPPVANWRAILGSRFGRRTDPVTGAKGVFHNGLDLRVAEGTPLQALSDGTVTFAGALPSSPDSGVALGVKADQHTSWSFSHLSRLAVRVGDKVTAGQVVAFSGNTGKSTGPHLHLVVRIDGQPVDPVSALAGGSGGAALLLAALGVWAAS